MSVRNLSQLGDKHERMAEEGRSYAGDLETLAAGKPVRINRTRFFTARICEIGKRWRTYPHGEIVVDTLGDALAGVVQRCSHKDRLAIRERAPGKSLLHLYAIKKRSTPSYQPDPATNGVTDRRVHPLYADYLCTIDELVLEGEG